MSFYVLRSFSHVGRSETQAIGPFEKRAVASLYRSLTDSNAQSRTMYEYCYGSRVMAESKLPAKIDFRNTPCEDVVFGLIEQNEAAELKKILKASPYVRSMPKKLTEHAHEEIWNSFNDINVDCCMYFHLNKSTIDEYKITHGTKLTKVLTFIVTSTGRMEVMVDEDHSTYFGKTVHGVLTADVLTDYIENTLAL